MIAEDSADSKKAVFRDSYSRQMLQFLAIASLAVLANYQSLSCFFFADDLLCLDYLYDAFHGNPQIFVERLFSAWQDPFISKLYRPVCDLLFFFDYLVSGSNAFVYHLSNLCLHVLNCLCLFYFIEKSCSSLLRENARATGFFSAALFAVYPPHVEAIVWLVCRADLLAVLFALLSIIFLDRTLRRGKSVSLFSLVLAFLSYLSKESAAALPLIVFTELLFLKQLRIKEAFKVSSFYLIPSILYFALRYFVLGTLTGGYSGSFAESISRNVIDRLLDPDLYVLLGQGVNLSIFKEHDRTLSLLQSIYVAAAIFTLIRIPFRPWDRATLSCLAFFLSASLISLLPAFQVLGLTGLLSNSRVFYFASAFYLPFIAAALYPSSEPAEPAVKRNSLLICASLILILLVSSFALISWQTYGPWLKAGSILQELQKRTHRELIGLKEGQRLVVLNLCSSYRGAHMIYEFKELKTLLGKNFYGKDLSNLLQASDEFPDFLPLSSGRLRSMLLQPEKYKLLCFDLFHDSGELLPAKFSVGKALASGDCKITESQAPGSERVCILELAYPSEFCDSSILQLDVEKKAGARTRMLALGFIPGQEALAAEDLPVGILDFAAAPKSSYHIPCLDLRKAVGLSPASKICLRLPESYELKTAKIIGSDQSAQLKAAQGDFIEMQNGNYKPCKRLKDCHLVLDVSAVSGAEEMLLERAESGYVFQFGKVCVKDPLPYKHTAADFRIKQKRAEFELSADRLSPGARYNYRLFALDRDGNRVGFSSDNVCVDLR